MDIKKQLLSFARMFLPSVGFVFTCIGAYLVSQQNKPGFDHRMVPVYIMIVFGFLAMLIGVFWSLLFLINPFFLNADLLFSRPNSFPPPYEETQCPFHVSPGSMHEEVVSVDGVPVVLDVAPPLYTQDSSESPDCRWSWEPPPRYSQVVHTEHN
uniref:Transmembrane protein 252 n=1 Tax=Poecilia latipinna TaxID=48699 RepID=A0A3B3UXU5_9TELE